jgi:hypothetical protein
MRFNSKVVRMIQGESAHMSRVNDFAAAMTRTLVGGWLSRVHRAIGVSVSEGLEVVLHEKEEMQVVGR